VVVGGGKYGPARGGILARRLPTDRRYYGMLATVMNCLALEAAIERRGAPARTRRRSSCRRSVELFYPRCGAQISSEADRAARRRNPAIRSSPRYHRVLRAAEIGAQAVLKANQCRWRLQRRSQERPFGETVRPSDPSQAIEGGYKVMDATAFALAARRRCLSSCFRSPSRVR